MDGAGHRHPADLVCFRMGNTPCSLRSGLLKLSIFSPQPASWSCAQCYSGGSATACLGQATIATILGGETSTLKIIKGSKMVDHETRRKIIRQWMSLPKDKRQTPEQAADFARKAVEQNVLKPSRREPYERVVGWLLPRTGRSHTSARRQG